MRASSLLHLYRVRLWSRWPQELLAIAGIAIGVALTFAALVANTSLIGSARAINRGVVGTADFQVAARGPEGLDGGLVSKVRRIDGVAAAAAFLEAQANLIGPRGRRSVLLISGARGRSLLGGRIARRFEAAAETTRIPSRRALALTASLAASLGVRTGDRVQLELGRHRLRVPVGGVLSRARYGDIADSSIAAIRLRFVQRLADLRNRISRIWVYADPGRRAAVQLALRTLAPLASVTSAHHDVAAFRRAASPVTQIMSIFSVFAAFIGFLFAFSAVLLTVPQRRRFIADLRMAGHGPWVTLELLLFDAIALGAIGSLIGLAAGYLAVHTLLHVVPGLLANTFPIAERVTASWRCVALAVIAGLLAACFAVLVPFRDVLRVRGGTAIRGRDGYGPGLEALVLGVATLAAATALVAVAPQAGAIAFGALASATMLFIPSTLRVSASAFERATRTLRTPVPVLAALELRSRSTRTRAVAMASTAAIAVGGFVALDGSVADVERGVDAIAHALNGSDEVWVTFPADPNSLTTTPLSLSRRTIRTLRALPGVGHVAVYRSGFLDIGDRRTWVQGLPESALGILTPAQIRVGDARLARQRLRERGWVVLSTAIARRFGVDVGERVTLPSPVPTAYRVAAISSNLGWPSGAIVLNAGDYLRAWGSSVPNALQIAPADGTSPSRLAMTVRRALPADLPARAQTSAARLRDQHAAARENMRRMRQISTLVLVSAIVAIVGAMAGMFWQRRPAIAQLKVHGYPDGELWRGLLVESALLLGTGCVVGSAFGLYGQLILTNGLRALTDFPAIYSVAGLTALQVLLRVTVVAVAMVALPGWLAVRVRPTPGGVG